MEEDMMGEKREIGGNDIYMCVYIVFLIYMYKILISKKIKTITAEMTNEIGNSYTINCQCD